MRISICQWREADLQEVAHLTCAAKEADRQTSREEAVEGIANWLREQFAELPRWSLQTKTNKR
jgi:hypothetical protein